MKSLSQYIDLYAECRRQLDLVPKPIAALRQKALDALRVFSEQTMRRAPYTEAAIDRLLEPDYGLNIQRMGFAVDLSATFRCEVPNISTLLGVTLNDTFRPTESLMRNIPEGLTVCSLTKAAAGMPSVVERYLNTLAADSTPQAALNTLLFQDGVFVYAAKGVSVERPVQLVNIFNAPVPLMAPRRLLVVAEQGASLRLLLCDHSQRNDIDYLSNEVIEVFVHRDASVEIYTIEENGASTRHITSFHCRQEEGARLTLNTNTLSTATSTATYTIDLAGAGADTRLGGLVIADAGQTVVQNVELTHSVPDCTSTQNFKFALSGKSKGAFGGKIVVKEGAVRTNAAQTNRNLIASDDARMTTAPQLEIYCDEVKCSHGATTGQLDPLALFYMRSRGIPEAEARLMLTQAFMADVVDSISYDLIRDRLRQLVERRLSGEKASCAACAAENTCHC